MQGGQTVNCLCEAEMLARQRIGVPLSLIVGRFSSQCIPPISSDTGPLSWLPVLFESADGKYITARHGNCQLRALSQALNSTVKMWKTKKPPVTAPRCMATAQFVCGRHIFFFFFKEWESPACIPLLRLLFLWIVTQPLSLSPLQALPLSLYGYSWTVCAYRQPFHLFIPFSFNQRVRRTDSNSSWQYSQIHSRPDSIRHTSPRSSLVLS